TQEIESARVFHHPQKHDCVQRYGCENHQIVRNSGAQAKLQLTSRQKRPHVCGSLRPMTSRYTSSRLGSDVLRVVTPAPMRYSRTAFVAPAAPVSIRAVPSPLIVMLRTPSILWTRSSTAGAAPPTTIRS